jgi:hypothetical protein
MDIVSVGFHLFFVLMALGIWKSPFFPSSPLFTNRTIIVLWQMLMFTCAALVYLVLTRWSAPSVREDSEEITFYLVFSMIWIPLAQGVFAFLGISLRDDAAERRNPAAAFAVIGLTIGATFCVAGANIGDGPGFEVVLFCASLATGTLLALWTVFTVVSDAADTITIERDLSTGIRAGGWLAGPGIVLGACVAGDWISLSVTLRDFVRFSWPLTIFTCLYAIFERAFRRRALVRRPSLTISIFSVLAMAAACGLYAKWIGIH